MISQPCSIYPSSKESIFLGFLKSILDIFSYIKILNTSLLSSLSLNSKYFSFSSTMLNSELIFSLSRMSLISLSFPQATKTNAKRLKKSTRIFFIINLLFKN